ncbi:unnamed protein product [Sphagnum troendelagicum]|uniref:Protein SCAR n=1 Tax=Sphagnum troendelagicum TaxID=128251 RepID=A0ABP0UZF9_9BRYO
MPLVRYEVRCEHSLANPELFRAAGGGAAAAGSIADDDDVDDAKAAADDVSSQGLLEGVAVAGLIGIVRQLGNLVEFAGEIFCELHEQLTALKRRGNGLKSRLLKLETEVPVIEKELRNSTDQFRYNYIAGSQWHPILLSKQNNLIKSELPNFVRNLYDNCRGPPRLFLLDKFDVAGEGACMKRYTDPSFYTRVCSGSLVEFRKVLNQSQSDKGQENHRWYKIGPEIQGSFLCFSHRKRQSSFIRTKNMEDVSGATISPQMPVMEQETRTMDAEFAKGPSLEFPEKNKTNVDDEIFLEEEEERELSASDGELFVDALATMDTASSDTEEDSETDVIPSSEGVFGLLLHRRNLSKERSTLEEKEVPEAASSRVERYLMKQQEEGLGFQEAENLWFTPINLWEVDDDLGYEKQSPCRLTDLAPSFLNQFACQTHTIESQREKAPGEALTSLQQEKLQESTGFQERRQQAGFGHEFLSSRLVSLPEVLESWSEDLSATQKADTHVQDRSSLVVNERETILDQDMITSSITDDDHSECRTRSVDESCNPFIITSASSPMSYSVSESASQEEECTNFSLVHSPLMSPWSKVSISAYVLFPDSSGSDDSFRIHSVQSPPVDIPIVSASASPTTLSTEQKHSDAHGLLLAANAVLT